MSDDRIIKTYVWHNGQCFFVSTIERDPSCEGSRYNETLAWEFDWSKQERGKMVAQESGIAGSIWKHQLVVQALFDYGNVKSLEHPVTHEM